MLLEPPLCKELESLLDFLLLVLGALNSFTFIDIVEVEVPSTYERVHGVVYEFDAD
jgi:hypothetical protein